VKCCNVLDPIRVPGRGAPKKSWSQVQIDLTKIVPYVNIGVTISEHATWEVR
jgi:hypothetical protein